MKHGLIIFDMDGTLIDSSAAMTQSVNYVRARIGLPPIDQKMLEYHINQPDHHLPKIFYNTDEYDPQHRAWFKEHYLEHVHTMIALYPDIAEMLKSVYDTAHLAIATNASDFFAHHMLEHMKIDHYFSAIVGSNNVAEPKPSPLMIQHLMDSFSLKTDHTVLVGDSLKDEQAALNAGIDFFFVEWGYGSTSAQKTTKVQTVSQLQNALQKRFI